jgi:hypothetical protein
MTPSLLSARLSGAVLLIATTALLVVGGASAALRQPAAKTYYVSSTGSDANNGRSLSTPWRSLEKANTAVRAGDTVVLSGHFVGQSLNPHTSGTAVASITFRAGPAGATLDGPGPLYPGGTLQGIATIAGLSYVVVDGLTFTYSDYVQHPLWTTGVRILKSNHVTIRNCSFTHVPLLVQQSSDNDIENNVIGYYVRSYVNPTTGLPDPQHPLSSGDMVSITGGSSRNTFRFNSLSYAGHSLLTVGDGTPGEPANSANEISDNVFSNPWYRDIDLAGDGGTTVLERNQIRDSVTQPTVYDTVLTGKELVVSRDAVQVSGSNFVIRSNTITNNVATRGVITLGARWYFDRNITHGEIIESMNNQVVDNVVSGNRALAGVSFTYLYGPADAAAHRALPRLQGNLVSGNVFTGNIPAPAPWGGTAFSDVLSYVESPAAPWTEGTVGANQIVGNLFQGEPLTIPGDRRAVLISYTATAGAPARLRVSGLAAFETAVGTPNTLAG